MVIFDCRGMEPSDFSPRVGYFSGVRYPMFSSMKICRMGGALMVWRAERVLTMLISPKKNGQTMTKRRKRQLEFTNLNTNFRVKNNLNYDSIKFDYDKPTDGSHSRFA